MRAGYFSNLVCVNSRRCLLFRHYFGFRCFVARLSWPAQSARRNSIAVVRCRNYTTNKFQCGFMYTRARSATWTRFSEGGTRSPGPGGIAESNIRRTFTVRFPNLYCVWQRCRDIRGSYRNVLLLIVLQPEGSGRGRRVVRRTRTESRERETRFERTGDGETAEREKDGDKGEGKRIYGRKRGKGHGIRGRERENTRERE